MGFLFLFCCVCFFYIRPSQAYLTINTCFYFCLYQAGGLSNYCLSFSPSGTRHFHLKGLLSPLLCVCVNQSWFHDLCSQFLLLHNLRDSDAKPIPKDLWRPFPVALLIHFCLDQMAPGFCDCMGVLLITLFISPSAQFKGQISCNTFASKISHSSPLLFGHHTSDICSVTHYTPKLLDLIHVFINSITKAGRFFVGLFANPLEHAANSRAASGRTLERRGACRSPKSPV